MTSRSLSGFRGSASGLGLILLFLVAVYGIAIPAETGSVPKLVWKFATNDWVLSLALGRDGAVYAGTWTGAVIYVLAPNGKLRREVSMGNSPNYGVAKLAVANDGSIYAESFDERLYALAPSGKRKWKLLDGGPAVAVGRDGAVYAYYFAFDPKTGVSRTKFPGLVFAVGNDNTVYVRCGGICACGPDGALKWKSGTGTGNPTSFPIGIGGDGTIYFASYDKRKVRDPATGAFKYVFPPPGAPRYQVLAVDPHSDTVRWSFKIRGAISSAVQGRDGTVDVGSYDGHVYALDPGTGMLKWRFWTGGKWGQMPVHALAVADDGTVYAGAGRFVEAIRPP